MKIEKNRENELNHNILTREGVCFSIRFSFCSFVLLLTVSPALCFPASFFCPSVSLVFPFFTEAVGHLKRWK